MQDRMWMNFIRIHYLLGENYSLLIEKTSRHRKMKFCHSMNGVANMRKASLETYHPLIFSKIKVCIQIVWEISVIALY